MKRYLLILMLVALAGCPKPKEPQVAINTPTPAPAAGGKWTGDAHDVTLTTLDGKTVQLSELAGGKPLMLNFWADW